MSERSNGSDEAELEALLRELAPSEEARAELLESHRQLEKDLLRLADPLPPPDFLNQVMLRVSQAPARPLGWSEVRVAAGIVASAVALAVVSLVSAGGSAGGVGIALGRVVIAVRQTLAALVGSLSAVNALWDAAALPLAVGVIFVLGASMVALRRAALPASGAEVST